MIRAQLLGAATELVASQTVDQPPQLLDLGVTLVDRGHHIAQHLLQRGWVVRQGGEVDRHGIIMIDLLEPAPMTPA